MRVARSLLVLGGFAAIPVGFALSRPVESVRPPSGRVAPLEATPHSPMRWDSLSSLLVARDPFRADRVPAPVAFDPNPVQPSEAPPAPPKPALLLTGIVWGTAPSAIIEGLPGLEGSRLMLQGDVAGGITLRRIGEHRVVLSGYDTTWTLVVRRPW
jgi:hypothetical protein